jgi:hypothetical protein
VHFGLGDATSVDGIEIRWPSGAVEQIKLSSEDRIFTVTEGKGVTAELCRDCPVGKSP